MSEPDRFEAKARQIVDVTIDCMNGKMDHAECVSVEDHIAAAIRAEHDETRASALDEAYSIAYEAGAEDVADQIEQLRALAFPAAAPAAEVEKVTPELLAAHAADLAAGRHDLNGAYGCSICGTSPAPPSEPAAPEKDLLPPCTCHYAAAEFCKYHGPRLRAERAASVAPAPLLPRVLAALETWGFAALAAELRAYIATAKGEGKT